MTVRYYQLAGECTEKILADNQITPDDQHNRLTAEELRFPVKKSIVKLSSSFPQLC
jgi:hypothetical protein